MNLLSFDFEKHPVTFQYKNTGGVMVNATEMAKVFNKPVEDFLENTATQKLISACLKNENSDFLFHNL